MACPICGANCRCRKRGPGGICCDCHKHKAQKTFTAEQLTEWRTSHGWEKPRDDSPEWRCPLCNQVHRFGPCPPASQMELL